MIILNQKYLKSILHYNKKTGIFTWVNPPKQHPRMKNRQAGRITNEGYCIIKINNRRYQAHRLAWLYVYGRFPSKFIDHADGDPINNKINNLRECTSAQNQANRTRDRGKCLPKGVKASKTKFQARITFNGDQIHLGTFESVEAAAKTYFEKAKELYGQFARSA